MGPEFLLDIAAKTALETPQILVSWNFDTALTSPLNGVPWPFEAMYLRRSLDRFPEVATEGTAILTESYSTDPSTSKADIALDALKNYYYSLFFYYKEHSANPLGLDDDISRVGSVISAVVNEHTYWYEGYEASGRLILAQSDGVKSGSSFTSALAEFRTHNVRPSDLLRIVTPEDRDLGYYEILSVDSETQITIDGSFTAGTDIQFDIYSGDEIYWLAGVDYHRKQSLWRYNATQKLVTDKVDLTGILEFEEYVAGFGFAGYIGPSGYFIFCTQKRWILVRDKANPTELDILEEHTYDGLLKPGFVVAGCHFSVGTMNSKILDSENLEVVTMDLSGTLVDRCSLANLEEFVAGSPKGITGDLSDAFIFVGNRNYVLRLPASPGGGPSLRVPAPAVYTPLDVSQVNYGRDLLTGDIGYIYDQLTLWDSFLAVNASERLRSYTLSPRGGLWQQPYVADQNTIGLWHLDGGVATDSSAYGSDATIRGMTTDDAGRFGEALQAATASQYIDISAISGEWDGDEGSASLWFKAATASDLTSGNHKLLSISADENNALYIEIASGSLTFYRVAGATRSIVATTHPTPDTDWHCYECTWSHMSDAFNAYLDGVKIGTTQTSIGSWAGALATATIGSPDTSCIGSYDECRILRVACLVPAPDYVYTSANKAHAFSGRDYTKTYDKGDPLGFFYRDKIYTPTFLGGDYLIRNDYERERLSPANKVLPSTEVIFRGSDPLPTLGDIGRLSRMIGLFLDRVADDREAMTSQIYDLLFADVDSFEGLAYHLGIKGLDQSNWNVDKQRRYLRMMQLIQLRGGTSNSYRMLAKLLGFYVTLHTLQARRRWDSCYYNANFDSEIQAIPLDTMGSVDTSDQKFPLALLRYVFYKLSFKSTSGITSTASSRLLTNPGGGFIGRVQVGNLIIIAHGEYDAGTLVTDAEYIVTEVHSDTVIKVNRNWAVGGKHNVTYYNYWCVPVDDPDTDYLLTRFLDIAPDCMRVERYLDA